VFRRHLFEKVAIIGTGLLGGSLALALKKNNLAGKVVGSFRQEASMKAAREKGIIDEGTTDIRQAVMHADLVILASPVKVILEQIKDKEFIKAIKRGAIMTDVGSTKVSIVEAAQKYLPQHVLFVGSHPMAGSEKSGVAHANADLFKGAACIMTPVEKTNRLAKDKVKHLWTSLGANVVMMEPAKHDEALAYVSHLPHIVAFALMRAIPEEMLVHASSGLRDTTRIAGSSPKIWNDICASNYRHILKAIDETVRSLSDIRKAIVDHDEPALTQALTQAKTKRELLEKKNG
jgi:prephenate dehydrogenase